MTDEDLFEKYYRDALTVGELDELKRRLRESAESRKAFARYTEERSILVRLTGRLAGMESRELPGLPANAPLRRAPLPAVRRSRNPFVIVAGVAAAAVVLFSVLLTLPSTPKPAAPSASQKPVKPVVVTPEPTPEVPKPVPEPLKPLPEPPKPQPVPEEPPKKPEPLPTPKPPEPAPVKPEEPKKPVEPPKRETVAEKAIATLEKVDGTVLRVAGTAKGAIKAGETLLPGQGLEAAGAKSAATFAYPDGTRVRLEGETIVLHLQSEGGKRFTVQQGAVAAEVAAQPDGQPLTIFSSHAQAAVLGTTLRFAVSSTGTRVEVRQGKVQVTRKSDQKSVLVQADQAAEVLDSPNGNDGAWTKYSRKVETGTSAQITIAVKTGTRSPSGPTVGFDLLRLVPGGGDDFEAMPRWDSAFDAAWGGAATWTIEAGGQAGRFLQAARPGPGSSAKAKVFAVPSRATVDVSAFLKCPSGSTADFWMEFGYRLGSHTAQDFDVNGAAWTIVKKFDSSPGGEIEIKQLPAKK